MKYIVVFVIFFFPLKVYSQTSKIWGKVVDSKDNSSIENVSIYIRDSNQGTFSNEEGNFIFTFDGDFTSIIFQIIGYKPVEILISEVSDNMTIRMDQDPYFLQEVLIEADSSLQIMQNAFSRIKQNYPNKQHLLKAYYRESVLRDDNYVRFLDAAIGINDFSYRSDPLRRKIEVYNLRKSKNFVEESLMRKIFALFLTDENDFLISLNFRDILRRYHREPSYFRGINKDLLSFFDFKVDSIFKNGMEPVAKISFSAPTGMFSTNGFFLVNLTDYAVISIEMTRVPTDLLTKDLFLKKALSNYSIVEYRKVNDRYYLSRFFSQGTENLAAIDSDSKSGIQVLKMELWVNEVFDNKRFFEKIKNKNKLEWKAELRDLDIPYDSAFWKSYNFIPDSLEYQKMVRDLEKLNSNN
ncbi:carboxypeptidase-like regulatory domain-containing protein [Algoriphagus hitonicola]|uniref:CarboxypepD_reg-like domain-containing protein n=1 Tax=Algoriphagus hitonicola TaxID=435880 RepID=A0A1I2SUV1_9BACT|nr:carboxypeptidase-like regulatory domain-containing protein [Algoriphagus hitonicola]SFG56470.1 CarboxypepD_reg-like domain-containing protein [Algoriphagus hitonicola]